MTTIFGNPGSNELPFLKDFPEDFEYILGLHEGVVVGMADGFAQATGKPTLVNLHAAAGSGNAMGALTNAWYSHSPLVLTAGQQARSMIGVEPMLANVDAPQLPRPLVKWSYEPACPQDVPRALSQAIHTAGQPAPGPVYLSVPHDDWQHETSDEALLLSERKVLSASAPSRLQIEDLARRLNAATNPVLVLGAEVDARAANSLAVQLAEQLRMPTWIAPSAPRCPFPTRHACFRGILPAAVAGLSRQLEGHDLIMVIGAPVFRYHQHAPGRYLPAGAALVHLTGDSQEAARAPIGDALVGDIGQMLEALLPLLGESGRSMPTARPRPEREADSPGQLAPANVFSAIDRLSPEDAIYVVESTSTSGAFWQHIEMRHPGSYFFPAAGGLGFGLPAAVGVQLAQPERRVVAIIGDGSANYGITALWSAARYRAPVTFVILKNGTYGALRWFSKLLNAPDPPGLDIPGLDFCALASGYGVKATATADHQSFERAFQQALMQTAEPMLIEVPTALTDP
jgi:benzoylformate decarboxylase